MKKRRVPRPDVNQVAHWIVAQTTSGVMPASPEKNPHAVELGKLGGRKGGLARRNALSATRRSEIASKAARTRWKTDQVTTLHPDSRT
jgi:hypothetical protein